MEMIHEEWRPVVGHEGKFEVSNLGRVKALAHEVRHWCGRMIPKPERVLTPTKHTGGYRIVSLRNGTQKAYIHRLVMAAFARPAPHRADVNHINGDKTDNRLCNLEYCNRLHNVRHAIATGLQNNAGEGNGMSKYTAEQIANAHKLVQCGASQLEAARASVVSLGMVQQVVSGKRWKHLNLPVLS